MRALSTWIQPDAVGVARLRGARNALAGAAVAAALLGVGCTGAGPPVGSAAEAVPADLTVDVSVLVGSVTGQTPGAAATAAVGRDSAASDAATSTSDAIGAPAIPDGAQRRQGRYVLFPDGTLNADVGASIRPDVRPGTTRRLTTAQVEQVWTLARQLGLADPDNGQPPGNAALVVAAPDQVVHVVSFLADGRSWRFVRRGPYDGALDPATSPFVRELAALAWVTDEPPAARRPAVVRYDFGPDPYAMYRAPAADERSGRTP